MRLHKQLTASIEHRYGIQLTADTHIHQVDPSAWNCLRDPVLNPNATEAAFRRLLKIFLFARYYLTLCGFTDDALDKSVYLTGSALCFWPSGSFKGKNSMSTEQCNYPAVTNSPSFLKQFFLFLTSAFQLVSGNTQRLISLIAFPNLRSATARIHHFRHYNHSLYLLFLVGGAAF